MYENIICCKLNNDQIARLTLQLEEEIDNLTLYSTDKQIKSYVQGILTTCYLTYNWLTYKSIEAIIKNYMITKYDMYISI